MNRELPPDIADILAHWALVPDGALLETPSSRLLPVRRQGVAAMLKFAAHDEERRGAALMRWYDGAGAARVIEVAGDALLLERAEGSGSLAALAQSGKDDAATAILCTTVLALHAPRPAPPPALVPLKEWFASLLDPHQAWDGPMAQAAETAAALLARQTEPTVLHGDIHHGNVLDFGARGWLAIDPKALWGDRAFDYANLFCNPDPKLALRPARFRRRLDLVAQHARIERQRLLQWILAYAGLSAAWHREDGGDPDTALSVARLAIGALEPA